MRRADARDVSAHRFIFGRPVVGVALWAVLACAPPPPPVEPGTGSLWGELVLVPHQGVVLPGAADASYGDPRLADVRLVDYSRPGFAVVYLDAPASRAGARISIREAALGARLEPERAVIGAAGALEISNRTGAEQIVSCPELQRVRRLAPGETLELTPPAPGELHLHLLGGEPRSALVFASPGPFARVGDDARWQISGVTPGRAMLRAWHPRFPPLAREIEVRAGAAERIDLALGVDASGAAP
jgi:hypothetical protein